jgi:hypothetical protein
MNCTNVACFVCAWRVGLAARLSWTLAAAACVMACLSDHPHMCC